MEYDPFSDNCINLRYTKGLPLEYFKYHGEPHPSSFAMTWCMLATGVNRIFTKADMAEFLFRLPIVLDCIGIVETWLMKDHILKYKVKGKKYTLTREEVAMHFGLEIIDSTENIIQRSKFLERISDGLFTAMFTGMSGDFSVIDLETDEDGNIKTTKENYLQDTIMLFSKADFFSKDLMSFIPDETFTDPNPFIDEKNTEIRTRKARISALPAFDINKIPRRMLKRCLDIIYVPEHADKLLKDPASLDMEARPLIYLAWVLGNGLLIKNGPFTEPVEGVPFNYKEYYEDGGYNLEDTIETYNLEEVAEELGNILLREEDEKHLDGIWTGELSEHPLYIKHNITREEVVGLAHLYYNGIETKKPYYGGMEGMIYLEAYLKNDHNGSLKLFDRIFSVYGYSTPCGLSRLFVFSTEAQYHEFMNDIAEVLLMGFYAFHDKSMRNKNFD